MLPSWWKGNIYDLLSPLQVHCACESSKVTRSLTNHSRPTVLFHLVRGHCHVIHALPHRLSSHAPKPCPLVRAFRRIRTAIRCLRSSSTCRCTIEAWSRGKGAMVFRAYRLLSFHNVPVRIYPFPLGTIIL